MVTVAVTGASGYLGRVLLGRLGADADVSRVVGIDVAEPGFTTRNVEFYRMDVRASEVSEAIDGCDAVVHLAALRRPGDADEMRDVNVGGTRSVLDAASRAGVRKIVFASSGSVYGAHPDNDYPLTESSPVRPPRDDVYAMSEAEAEDIVTYHAEAHPETVVTTLRLAWVCGPSLPTRHALAVDQKVRFVIEGYDPPFQAVHEDDAAGALTLALDRDLPGTFNVCADDAVEQPEEILGQRRVTLSVQRARRVLTRAHSLGLSGPASDLAALMYPQVMSNQALRDAGGAFAYSTADALRGAAQARRDWIAVGKLRFRPRRVAMAAGTLGAVALGTRLRRRRRPGRA